MPPPTFGPIPDHLWMKGSQFPKRAGEARFHLEQLQRHMRFASRTGPRYGYGSWGYTVIRTVYTPESDALFAKVIDKIKRCVYYSTHSQRFPAHGTLCQEMCITYAEPNDEISRRFYLDVIEDKANLEELDGPDHFMALYDYFRQWVVSVGETPDDAGPLCKNPRFRHFLVIDAESLRSLSEIPDEMPPLRCAADPQEKAAFLGWGSQGWLWLLDATVMPKPELYEDRYRGWCRIDGCLLEYEWFEDLHKSEEDPYYVEREERPENSGVYYYTGF